MVIAATQDEALFDPHQTMTVAEPTLLDGGSEHRQQRPAGTVA